MHAVMESGGSDLVLSWLPPLTWGRLHNRVDKDSSRGGCLTETLGLSAKLAALYHCDQPLIYRNSRPYRGADRHQVNVCGAKS